MRPATGSNNPSDRSKVSVRTDSGGHSFCVDSLPGEVLNGECVAEFCIATHKTVLVPAEVFEESSAAQYLAVAGVPCAADEEPVWMADGGIVAVAAVARSFKAAVGRLPEGCVSFTSPLLGGCDAGGRRLQINTFGNVSFFRLSDNGRLRVAEALKTDSADDILYYLNELDGRFGLNEYLIYIYGDGAESAAQLAGKYFKNVRCE